MDPITHAAAGAVVALAYTRKPKTAWYLPFSVLVAVAPDVDVLFAQGAIDYLVVHRGTTHSLFALPILAACCACMMYPLWRKTTLDAWSWGKVYLLACVMLAVHIWLDCVTTYGTMIFQPFSSYRVRLNGIFIVDLFLVLPLLWAAWQGRRARKFAVLGLIWIFLYPACCVGLCVYHQRTQEARLRDAGIVAQQLTVLPDVFAPLYWRVLYQTATPYVAQARSTQDMTGFAFASTPQSVWQQGVNVLGQPNTAVRQYAAAPLQDVTVLCEQSYAARVFFSFTFMPVVEQRRQTERQDTTYRFYDLRFDTMLPLAVAVNGYFERDASPFQFWVRQADSTWTTWHMVGPHMASEPVWAQLVPRKHTTWWQWLLGYGI